MDFPTSGLSLISFCVAYLFQFFFLRIQLFDFVFETMLNLKTTGCTWTSVFAFAGLLTASPSLEKLNAAQKQFYVANANACPPDPKLSIEDVMDFPGSPCWSYKLTIWIIRENICFIIEKRARESCVPNLQFWLVEKNEILCSGRAQKPWRSSLSRFQ